MMGFIMAKPTSASGFAYAAILMFVTGMTLVITQRPPTTFTGSPPLGPAGLLMILWLVLVGRRLSTGAKG